MSEAPGIVIVRGGRVAADELRRLVLLYFEDMVKYVVERVRELTGALVGEGEPLP